MHGLNPSEELLAEYTLVGFLLQTLNVTEVQDVVLRVLGKGLASLTFDEDYKVLRIRRKEPRGIATTHIALERKNVITNFADGFKGVVTKSIRGAKHDGATGFFKGLGQGVVGFVARSTGGVVDFASTSLDLIKRTVLQEEIVLRIRYPRHVGSDGIVRPYITDEAMGFYIFKRLEDGNYAKSDTYVAHINCSESSLRLLFVTKISSPGFYELDWEISYEDLKEESVIKINTNQIQILTKEPKATGTIRSQTSFGKLIKFKTISDAKYIVDKIGSAMYVIGLKKS
ncbi:unnamed protein product [Rotaria sp. Silwood2]|nr:unnamed protein product [Rotaria sp. Silwood2]